MPRSSRSAVVASLLALTAPVAFGTITGCGPSAVKAPVGPPPEYEAARPPVPASSSAPTPAATHAPSASPAL